MSRRESTLPNMVLALAVLCFVCSAILGVVYKLTEKTIAAVHQQQKVEALKKVLPEFDNNPVKEQYTVHTDRGDMVCYPGKKNDHLVGTAVEAFSDRGYSGRIEVIIGFLPDGTIRDSQVLTHQETPGLGAKIDPSQSDFSKQFQGKNPKAYRLKVTKDGGQVDGITAATISSRAYCDALQAAYDAVMVHNTVKKQGAQ